MLSLLLNSLKWLIQNVGNSISTGSTTSKLNANKNGVSLVANGSRSFFTIRSTRPKRVFVVLDVPRTIALCCYLGRQPLMKVILGLSPHNCAGTRCPYYAYKAFRLCILCTAFRPASRVRPGLLIVETLVLPCPLPFFFHFVES